MKALSLRQPWAWMVVRGVERLDGGFDRKTIENRRWSTTFRGRFLIHAAKGCTRDEYNGAIGWIGDVLGLGIADRALAFPKLKEIERGGIIGAATLEDVVSVPFFKRDGMLGLFDVPEQITRMVFQPRVTA